MTRTAELAGFLAELGSRLAVEPTADDGRRIEAAAAAVLDTAGCIVHGARQPWAAAARRHALAVGRADGASTVVGDGAGDGGAGPNAGVGVGAAGTSAAMAAFANGSAAHAFELDDVHEEAISHPGAVVVPAAVAVAEELGASGVELLAAVAVGYEAMGRAGIAVGPASHMLGGFHPTSMSGVFGAAAATATLRGFDATAMNHAIGVAATLASGTMEFAASGGMTKRIHAGRAAEAGVTAAALVADGFEGPADGLAGTYGFCRVFSAEPLIELLTDGLGERWMIDEITVKPYAACSDIHPLIQAATELRAEHDLAPDRIARIEAWCPTKAATQNDMDGTVSVMAAQYSAQYNIAAALLADPTDPATYTPAVIAEPAMAAMQSRVVSLTAAPEFDATYAWKMGGRLVITLDDGTALTRTVLGQLGSMHDPLATEQRAVKLARLAGPVAAPLTAWARSLPTAEAVALGPVLDGAPGR